LKKWIKSKGTRTRLSASPTTLPHHLPPTSTRCLLHAGHDVVPCIALLCLDLSCLALQLAWPQRSCPWLGLHNACLPFAAATPWLAAVPLLASCQCCCFATCLLLLLLLAFVPWLLALLCCCLRRCTPALPLSPICTTFAKAEPLAVFIAVTPPASGCHWTSRYPKLPATLCSIHEQRRAAPRHRMAPKRQAPLSSSSAASDLPPA
jgi:hypothetical protein